VSKKENKISLLNCSESENSLKMKKKTKNKKEKTTKIERKE
jgi:hypothetical protein